MSILLDHFLNLFCLWFWVGVHWSICKSSYNVSNISYLNSPPSTALFHPLFPDSQNSLNRYHFCIYLNVYTSFGPPSPLTFKKIQSDSIPSSSSYIGKCQSPLCISSGPRAASWMFVSSVPFLQLCYSLLHSSNYSVLTLVTKSSLFSFVTDLA
jgi:hypothetical protein